MLVSTNTIVYKYLKTFFMVIILHLIFCFVISSNAVADPGTRRYCISGNSNGVGWSWGIVSGEGLVCSDKNLSVPEGGNSAALAAAFVASINEKGAALGVTAKVDPKNSSCFTITYTDGDPKLWVGDAEGTPESGKEVTREGVPFNPTIKEVSPIPTLTQWGLLILTILVVGSGIWLMLKKRRAIRV